MVGSAVEITVESRFCMKNALATIIAVVRVRLVVRALAGTVAATDSVILSVSPGPARWERAARANLPLSPPAPRSPWT